MENRWAIITGASSGIGWATAIEMASQGYNLCLIARRIDRLKALANELKTKYSITIECMAIDLRLRSEVERFLTETNNQNSQIFEIVRDTEILVNNAGLAKGIEKMQDSKIQDWDDMIDTNLKGLLYMTRGVLPFMIQKNRGYIINIGSVAGRWVYPGGGVYCASKFAVRVISEALRMDLIGKKIRVTNIEPGMVETEFSQVRFNGDLAKAEDVYKNMTPLSSKDIAETIGWCVSRPAHINIQELVIFPTDQAAVGQVYRKN